MSVNYSLFGDIFIENDTKNDEELALDLEKKHGFSSCLLYTSPSPRDRG